MNKEFLIKKMKECNQFDNQTIYEHCLAVKDIFIDLFNKDFKEYKLPNWFIDNFD